MRARVSGEAAVQGLQLRRCGCHHKGTAMQTGSTLVHIGGWMWMWCSTRRCRWRQVCNGGEFGFALRIVENGFAALALEFNKIVIDVYAFVVTRGA